MLPAVLRGSFLLVLIASAAPIRAADPGLQHFEQKIRPVLVKHCYECHSAQAKKVRGGLLLDTKAGLLKGGDSGPAIVPGKPVESLLLKALRHDELAMPPKEKLPDAVVADFERWISMGAPDPRAGQAIAGKSEIDLEVGKKFWAFQPIQRREPPAVNDYSWPRSDIDRFIVADLNAKGLKPARDADRRTLIRRATIALIGLPPTPQEINAFVTDPAADAEAFAKVVDRLLASSHFGERWGRHWLDLARYADSNGKDENLTFHEAYRYRDYVIDAFNRDKPFNEFIEEQIAGDLLPADNQARRDELLTATGFLVVGPKVLADRDVEKRRMDVVDEQVDTIGRVLLGMTLSCARCHDHKFDPIPTSDYYAMAGILFSTRTLDGIKLGNPVVSGWMLRPLGEDGAARLTASREHEKKLKALGEQIKKARDELKAAEDKAAMRVPTRFVGIVVDDTEAKLVGTWKPSTFTRPYVGAGYLHDDRDGKGAKSATFTPNLPKAGEYEVQVSYTPGSGRAADVPVAIRFAGGEKVVSLNQVEKPNIDGLFRSVGKYRFDAGAAGSVTISNKGTTGHVIVDAVRFVPTGALENDPEMAMGVPAEVMQKIADTQARLKKLQADEKGLKAAAPLAPQLVMAVRDDDKPTDIRINIRGNPHQLGAAAPRGFLSVTGAMKPTIPEGQSGRLELARWLVDPANPLTARVFVNRVWKHLLGEGLVRTVDNFGVQGERPTQPELLDHLASRFATEGWSVKRLIRTIMLSRVYQLATECDASLAQADPENKLFGRAFRRRVEAEVIRDSILALSGRLDVSRGGPVVAHLGERAIDNNSQGGVATDTNYRRSVYLPVIRNDIPQIFEVFDFADPDVATGRRDATTVATQALYLMNSPFVSEQARQTAQRLLTLPGDNAARLADLYQRALGRAPTAAETENALRYLAECGQPGADAWSGICRAMFGCTEFRFVE
jgi:hypothetical protein